MIDESDKVVLAVVIFAGTCRLSLEAGYWMVELWYRAGDWAVLAVGWWACIAALLLMARVVRMQERRRLR